MHKISTKLTFYFFITVLIMETSLMFYLHQAIIHSRIDEELSRLIATGSNHRDVLIEYYSDTTMKHIVLMEKDNERGVIITDRTGAALLSSDEQAMNYLPEPDELQGGTDRVIVSDWRASPYIISSHPYQSGDESGYVVMFQSTKPIEDLVGKLNMHFGLAGVTSAVALYIIYTILSKFLTRPLVRMKKATEKLSKGEFDVQLPFKAKDELGELAESIRTLSKDLERLKKERNEFFAAIAHELSTPLTYLNGYSKVAMRKGISETERMNYMKIIGEESDKMKDLVLNLLDLAKMDEPAFTVHKENIEAETFLESVCKLVGPSFRQKQIQLELDCEAGLKIFADPIRLEQILLNLLDNALKYSSANSAVFITAYRKEQKTVISVADEGIGIPDNDIEWIFDKLYRVEKSRSRTSGGSGIGLAVVKELVNAHGGTIEVDSTAGRGSIFTLRI